MENVKIAELIRNGETVLGMEFGSTRIKAVLIDAAGNPLASGSHGWENRLENQDAGHGGSDPGARGVVEEKEMTAQTSEALLALLEADPNYIPLRSRESYDVTAKPSERAEAINAKSPQLLLSIHGNSAPEGSAAAGFECYPSVPGRTWHQESYYFAQQLAQGMQAAGAKLRGHGGIRYIYYQGEVKQLVESTHTEVRDERSFTLLEDVNCPAVLAEQCFVTSEEDVAQFGSEEGCKTVARVYYEAICAYFGTQPLDTPL